MDIDNALNALWDIYGHIVAGIQASSAAVDFQIIIICTLIFILSALGVYAIFIYGMKERTYEEAIAEQRKRNKEAIQQAKTEKTRKDKKFKKWNKKFRDRDEEKCLTEELDGKGNEIESKLERDSRNFSPEFETKTLSQKKKRKQRKPIVKDTISHQSSSEETDEQSSSGNENKNDFCDEKEILENTNIEDERSIEEADIKVKDSRQKHTVDHFFDKRELENCDEKTEIKIIPPITKSPNKRKRKNRSDHGSSNSESSEITTHRVLSVLKTGIFTEEELCLMLDILNCKQGGVGGWTKKNDPIPGLKRQIQEKEEALEAEIRVVQTTNEKLKSLRHEFNQEKSRALATERTLREKVNQHQQEIQGLHGTLQITHEQHVAEMQAKIQQLKTKLSEEHTLTVKRIKEENGQLQAMNRMESEKQQRSNLEVSRLQRELEQMRSAHEQYDNHQAAMQQAQDDLHHQIQQLEKHMEKLVSSHQDEEFSYKQRINEMSNKLQQAEKAHTSLVQELQNAQSVCSSLEADNNSLRKHLEEAKHQMNSSEQDRIELQARLEDLVSCIEQLQTEILDLTNEKNNFLKQIQDLNAEKETVSNQLAENAKKLSADMYQLSVEHSEADERALLDMEELDQKIQKKDFIIQQLLHQFEDSTQQENIRLVEEYRWKVQSLTEEIDNQKEQNKELRQNYENASEALRTASHRAGTLEELLNQTENTIQVDEKAFEYQERLERQLKDAEEKMKLVEIEASKRIQTAEDVANAKIETLQGNMYHHMSEVNAETEAKLSKAMGEKEMLVMKLESLNKEAKECLLKLDSQIEISDDSGNEEWITQLFHQTYMKNQKEISPVESKEINNLKLQMSEILEEKAKMKLQIENYVKVLAEAENVLFKVQNSVEKEEKTWKEEISSKDKNLKEILSENERLSMEKQALEANLEQLQGLREMQTELIELQSKLELEEAAKDGLVEKFQLAQVAVEELRNKYQVELKEKEFLRNKLEECGMDCASGCGDALAPELDDSSGWGIQKSEKRKKSRKKGLTGKK